MSLLVKVNGGTGAGSRRAPRDRYPRPWQCSCGETNPSYALKCLASGCREKRPA